MQLDILTPEKKIFSGQATSVSLPGSAGRFQVLNNHAPIISSLKKGTVKVIADSQETKWNITGGLVEVLKNKVTVLVERVE
ncbi:MAG: ATP synthase F1 subunit epsilon [Chitinophagales bacterium]